MVWLWENREMLVIETTLRSYLFAAVRNSCYALMNKNEIHREVHEHLYEEMRELFEDPDFYVVEDLTARMEEAINALPETYREAFVKNRFEQKTYRDIAEESGVSAKTIDYRIQQAIKQLRITLKDYAPLIGWLLYD
jgi:RNA polymerase sigma-70 factor (ECF subfamily)